MLKGDDQDCVEPVVLQGEKGGSMNRESLDGDEATQVVEGAIDHQYRILLITRSSG